MPDIKQLSPHLADLIAAGEVVERPASVVKELVENAIDAGAGAVTVEIAHGGMTLIRVTDNGCGIPADQAPTAFLRHATSKIATEYDLEAIGTLGFRGEALAAIAAVSRVELLTKTAQAPLGTRLALEGGTLLEQEEAGCPDGTDMAVRDLFFNTPARLKFMKKDAAEGAAVFAAVQHLALSHPELAVKFIRDGRQELSTPGDGRLQSAVYAVLGRDIAMGFTEVKGTRGDLSVSGFASIPACCRGSRSCQHFFVNGRYVKSKLMTAAVEEAYKNRKMVGRFPGCVIHLTASPGWVDVNVHPAKTEVKFRNDQEVFAAVHGAVLGALNGDRARPQGLPSAPRPRDTVTPNQTVMSFRDSASALRAAPAAPAPAGEPSQASSWRPAPTYRPAPRGSHAAKPAAPFRRVAPLPPLTPEKEPVKEDRPESRASILESGAAAVEAPTAAPEHRDAPGKATPVPPSPSPMPEKDPSEDAPVAETLVEEASAAREEQPWTVRGELFHTYVMVEQGETVVLIDKHAAHERANFDKLKAEGYRPMVQELLSPVVFTPAPEEREALLERLDLLARFGFEVEEFGTSALAVRAAPDYLDAGEVEGALTELARRIAETGGADPDAARDALMRTMACKAAIKGGQHNGLQELEEVARLVMSGAVKYCPHGRPVAVELTKRQMEKLFKRV